MCKKVSVEEVVISKVSRVNEQHIVRLVWSLCFTYLVRVCTSTLRNFTKKFDSEIVHFVITLKKFLKIAVQVRTDLIFH